MRGHNWEYFLEFIVVVVVVLVVKYEGSIQFFYLGISKENVTAFANTIVPLYEIQVIYIFGRK